MEQIAVEGRAQKMLMLPWWLVLIDGLFISLLGVWLLVSPYNTMEFLIIFLGAYWFIAGVFQLGGAFVVKEHRLMNIFMGFIGIVAGLTIMINPLMGTVIIPGILVIILGVEGILMGGAAMVQAFQGAGIGRFIFGLFSLVVGMILVLNQPFAIGATALPFALGIFALFVGPIEIAASLGIRKVQQAA